MRTPTQSINATVPHTDLGFNSHRLNRAKHHFVEETSLMAVIKVNIKECISSHVPM